MSGEQQEKGLQDDKLISPPKCISQRSSASSDDMQGLTRPGEVLPEIVAVLVLFELSLFPWKRFGTEISPQLFSLLFCIPYHVHFRYLISLFRQHQLCMVR